MACGHALDSPRVPMKMALYIVRLQERGGTYCSGSAMNAYMYLYELEE